MKKTSRKFVLVRTESAGVHFGTLSKREGAEVTLSSARRIWQWNGANTLHEIALHGVGVGSKISETVSEILLLNTIEILPISAKAKYVLYKIGWGA